jgi:hypothetical protein
LPRCWPEPSFFDSAAAFPTRSAKHRHVLRRRQRPREVLPGQSHGGLRRMSRPLALAFVGRRTAVLIGEVLVVP